MDGNEEKSSTNSKEYSSAFNYDHVFDDVVRSKDSLANPVALPVEISDVEFRKVYETPVGHKWNSWVHAYRTPGGTIGLNFKTIEGGPSDLESDYKWQLIGPKALAENGIRRTYRHMESKDDGQTWDTVAVQDATDISVPRVAPVLYVDNETLLGVGGINSTWDETVESYDIYTLPYVFIGRLDTALSQDNGATWKNWQSLNDTNEQFLICCHPVMLRDGTIVLPAYGKLQRNNDNPKYCWDACLFFSTDGGKSWSEPLVLAMGTPTLSIEEPNVAELDNGDLLVILRHSNPSKTGTLEVYCNCGQIIVKKIDDKWVAGPLMSTPMRFRGMPVVLRTRDGILICAGSGTQYNFSVDEGKTWSDTQISIDPMYNRNSHYPVLMELPDGRIMTIYHMGNDWPYPPPEDQWIHATFLRVTKL